MLVRLSIRDIVLIDRLDIDLGPGLTVLTGETGAGKSILLDAFGLALGSRGDGGLMRHTVDQGQVTAVFEVDAGHPVHAFLAEQGIAAEDQLILRRVQLADGRTRAFINDQPVSVQALKGAGAMLVEIHGQHDERAFVDTAAHRALLDAYGGLDRAAADVADAWRAWRAAQGTLAAHLARVENARREAEWLRHAVDELSRLRPEPGEETAVAARRAAMLQAEKIAEDLRDAYESVGGSRSPAPVLATALRRLERRTSQAATLVEPAVRALDTALAAIEEARGHLASALAVADHDPRELERIEERLFALRAAARKYNVGVDDLAALAIRYGEELAVLDAGSERLADLERAEREAQSRYRDLAQRLSASRSDAGRKLGKAVNVELRPLKLDRARFTTQLTTNAEAPGPEGFDRVEFWAQTNPGTRGGPMMKVASGGELARFLLALKVVLADRGSAPTLLFDEIDTGVGGAVADAIGLRLARLAERVQVIAVTHAPQVAARADRHFLVTKNALGGGRRVATRVAEVAHDHRREEIARMLAGAEITEEARAAAERLIRAAAG